MGAGGVALLVGVAVALVWLLGRPSVTVTQAGSALFDVRVAGLGAESAGVEAASAGHALTLTTSDSGFVPTTPLAQHQTVVVRASAAPPSWLRWLLGGTVSTTKTVHAPAVTPSTKVTVSSSAGQVSVGFDRPVTVVDYRSTGGSTQVVRLSHPAKVAELTVPKGASAGFLKVRAAAQNWERVHATATKVAWFVVPAGAGRVAMASPAPGSSTASTDAPIILTFDEPVAKALGTTRPSIVPKVAGSWSEPDADTLVFTPSGFGFGPGAAVSVTFDRPVDVETTKTSTSTVGSSNTYHFTIGSGSILRLQQLLAELHYLPLTFTPAPGVTSPTTFAGEVATISHPLAGTFSWRWPDTPASLEAQWKPGTPTVMVRGALMAFDAATESNYDGYAADDETVDQLANASTWKALLEAALAGKDDPSGYSYVSVTKTLPETLTLWENGSVVLTAPCNTGIPSTPTATGVYPIYVRYTVNQMTGHNPTGSYYDDTVYWINYFNGSDAVHGFPRATYGYPQSLGCVELPISTAEVAFGHLSIGDLVDVT